MTYADLLNVLTEAELRVKESEFPDVRYRSQETIDLCLERMRREGIDRNTLIALATHPITPRPVNE